jgi:lysophospholipase L1-like esterase
MPIKTGLTILGLIGLLLLSRVVPALNSFASFDPQLIANVVDLPLPKLKSESPPALEDLSTARLEVRAPSNLVDPTHSLDHFYAALLKGGTTRILHYGDSPTTGDLITADARAMLQKQFGDAGVGFILIARPWAWYNHRGVEMDASNWKIDVALVAQIKDGMHGLGGVSFIGSAGASARWRMKTRQDSIEVAYLIQPDGGAFAVDAEDEGLGVKELGVVETAPRAAPEAAPEPEKAAPAAPPTKTPGYTAFEIPGGATKFMVRVTRGTVRLYGVEFRGHPNGVIYSSLGINGANVTVLSHLVNGPHWTAELRHYKPSLVIVNYGTNESGYPKFVDTSWGHELREVVRRLHAALPDASVLLMSPMDRGEKNSAGEIATMQALPRLVSIEREIAAETGTAFFNTFAAMGGAGTMARWYAAEPRLVSADFIHPTSYGAKIVGELLYKSLSDGYNEYKLRQLNHQSDDSSSAGKAEPQGQPKDESKSVPATPESKHVPSKAEPKPAPKNVEP